MGKALKCLFGIQSLENPMTLAPQTSPQAFELDTIILDNQYVHHDLSSVHMSPRRFPAAFLGDDDYQISITPGASYRGRLVLFIFM
jgi:hypothetical protein